MIRFGVPLRSILLLGRYEKIAVSRDISIGNNYLRLLCTLPPDRERKISLMTTEEPNPITVSEEQAGPSKHTNRLIDSKSPYLLQHAHNPVDWWPWCDEALTLAKKENKLIFLSVGYSTCHWCHVMEKESFENEATARIMNENFINIKVDREERPDIDKIYMIFLMMTNGSGGWPMSIWLTPDLGPVTAGTYFPPTDRWGSVSFKKILTTIAEKWKTNPNSLRSLGTGVVTAINHSIQAGPPQDAQEQSIENKIQSAIYIFRNNYDSEWGGVMAQTKFPEISKLMLIYHLSLMRNGNDLDKMFFHTLNKIADGGIHDHVFGGFSRYSVDRQWHVPHFEKMLYDQAQLMVAYSSAFKITKNQKYLQVVDNLFKYIMKDLRHPFGGFYTGEDADSYPTIESIEKVEGAFYAWSWNEIKNIFENNENLPPNAFDIYCAFYDLTETGNVPPTSDPHGHLEGKNILIIRSTINSLAETFSTDPEAIEKIIKDGNNLLNGVREKRPRPHLDTKIITSWNGLLLTGLCKASSMSDTYKMKFLEPAKCLIDYFKKYAINPETNLLKRAMYPTQITLKLETLDNNNGFLDDYAFLINGLIDYYEATMDKEALNLADNLQIKQNELFWDVRHGGYFYTPENSANLVVRIKEDHDGAEPCGNSLSSGNLFRLYEYLGRPIYKETLEKLYSYYNAELTGYALPVMLSNAISYGEGGFSVLVVGGHNEDSENLMNIIRSFHIPGLLLYQIDPNSDNNLSKGSMDITKFTMIKDKPTVYICQKNACQLPINDPDVIKKNLEEIYRNNFEAQN